MLYSRNIRGVLEKQNINIDWMCFPPLLTSHILTPGRYYYKKKKKPAGFTWRRHVTY